MCGWYSSLCGSVLLLPTLPLTPMTRAPSKLKCTSVTYVAPIMSVHHLILQFDSGTKFVCNDFKQYSRFPDTWKHSMMKTLLYCKTGSSSYNRRPVVECESFGP